MEGGVGQIRVPDDHSPGTVLEEIRVVTDVDLASKASLGLVVSLSIMALFSSNMPSEVGLRLLLCPLSSNIVVRTACLLNIANLLINCCSVGVALPVYSTFKAIETNDQTEQQRWLVYWAAYGSFSIAEVFTDKLISWFPLYYHMKFAFLVWLQLPSVDGAKQLYVTHLRPFLLKHQARLDQIVEFSYGEMVKRAHLMFLWHGLSRLDEGKFVSAHQAEIQFAKTLLVKMWMSANEMANDILHPGQRRGTGAIEGPRTLRSRANDVIEGPETQVENSESENDE
ncbi:hypothetical protein C3L33_19540, partial [Rhododendron williamsianum]